MTARPTIRLKAGSSPRWVLSNALTSALLIVVESYTFETSGPAIGMQKCVIGIGFLRAAAIASALTTRTVSCRLPIDHPNNAAGIGIHDGGAVQLAFGGGVLGDVGQPQQIRASRTGLPFGQVFPCCGVDEVAVAAAPTDAPDPGLTYQQLDPLRFTLFAPRPGPAPHISAVTRSCRVTPCESL